MVIFAAKYHQINLRVNVIIISFAIFLLGNHAFAQRKQVELRYLRSIENATTLFPDEKMEIDSLAIPALVSQKLGQFYEQGHLSCTFRVSTINDQDISIEFFAGKIFRMVSLGQGNVSDEIMNKIGFRPLKYQNKPFSHASLVKLLNEILNYAENHGFPFASIKLDSISFQENDLIAQINYRSGPLILFDSLIVQGYDQVKSSYLMSHLGIYKGRPYEEKLVKGISNRIKLLPFISLLEQPEIQIREGKCTVILKLKQIKVSQVDGIIGVLPNQKGENELLITGQIMLDLRNLFSSGKSLALEWQSFNANSQLLDARYYHPNLFKTPVNIQGAFDLLKQDTTFLNRSLNLELSLLTKNSNQIGFHTNFFTSRIISTSSLEGITELPENNDFNLNYYGVNYGIYRYNNQTQPSSGWAFELSGSAGQKKIIKNPVVADDVYSGVTLNTLQIKFDGFMDKYWNLYKFLKLRTRLFGGHLNGKQLFPGDLYRIGGLNTLRGFTEKSFFASSFAIANLELRAYLSQDTFFMIFFDQGGIQDQTTDDNFQYPFGTGAGFSFNTDAGVFSFALALGKSNNQPFAFNYSKIHFGYISRF
jgi:outer membrane protein assembly factor BamA